MGPEASVSELIDCWVDQRLRRGEIEPLTGGCQRYNLMTVARFIGDPLAGDLTAEHVNEWRERYRIEAGPLKGRRLAASTMRTRLSQLRMFCEWLVAENIIDVLPTAGVRPPREPRRKPRGMSARDVALLLGTVPDSRGELVVLLAVQELLRRVEVHRLDVGDVDFDRRTVFVVGKGRHERVVPLSDETMHALDRYLTEWPASAGPLIRSYHDGATRLSTSTIGHLMTDWFRSAGVKRAPWDGKSMHALRHTGATDMADAGEDIRAIQGGLGHASLKATEKYVGLVGLGALREAMGGRRYTGPGHTTIGRRTEGASTDG